MPNTDTTAFLNQIVTNANPSGNYNFIYNFKAILTYLEGISQNSRKNIFSDSYWNKYPKYISWRFHNLENPRCHGRGISSLTKYLSSNKSKYPKTYKTVLNHSKGIFHNFAIENFSGKDKMSLAKRGLKSSDRRVKKASIRILPVNTIIKLANDSDWSIRAIVASRVSPSARPDIFLDSKNFSARFDAISASDFDKNTIFEMLNSRISKASDWVVAREITCLLDKLDDNDLLYYVNISGKIRVITDYFNDRLL